MPQRRREICRAEAEKLLPRIDMISMLCREGAASRDAFDIGQQQAAGGQRHNAFDITQPQRRAFQGGQASGNISRNGHAKRGEPKQGGGDD
jgi:hypothetical protein